MVSVEMKEGAQTKREKLNIDWGMQLSDQISILRVWTDTLPLELWPQRNPNADMSFTSAERSAAGKNSFARAAQAVFRRSRKLASPTQ